MPVTCYLATRSRLVLEVARGFVPDEKRFHSENDDFSSLLFFSCCGKDRPTTTDPVRMAIIFAESCRRCTQTLLVGSPIATHTTQIRDDI